MANTKAKGELIHEKTVLTSELAAIVGKTPQWIRQLTRNGVLKQVGRGKYILGESVQSYINHVQNDGQDENKPKYRDAKTEHELIKKEKAEMELRSIKGQLHEARDVRLVMSDMILTVKSKFQSIPTRISPKLDKEPSSIIEKELEKEISQTLRSLTDYSPELFAKKESEEE